MYICHLVVENKNNLIVFRNSGVYSQLPIKIELEYFTGKYNSKLLVTILVITVKYVALTADVESAVFILY